ncbi:MAG: Txe/YoeB family addiction module toxin [Pseudoflavonifractor sp.]
MERNGNTGIGKPEPLVGDFSGWWSRRINDHDRLVYRITDSHIEIAQCRTHYRDR